MPKPVVARSVLCDEAISAKFYPQGYDEILLYLHHENHNHTVLYTGVTNDLKRRVFEHKSKFVPGFTSKYNIDRLVYYEECWDAYQAITREKQIKGGSRQKKLDLIHSFNPQWRDLYGEILS